MAIQKRYFWVCEYSQNHLSGFAFKHLIFDALDLHQFWIKVHYYLPMPWTTTETMDNESTDENLTQDWSGDRYESICSESNDFLKKLDQGTDLKVLLDKRVSNLVKTEDKLGLLYLFFPRCYMNSIRQWTNINLKANGKAIVNEKKWKETWLVLKKN